MFNSRMIAQQFFTPEPPLAASWLARSALEVAPDLLGCTLVRHFPDGSSLRGMIVETEAYTADDPACHAYRRRTARNAVMFGSAGKAYVYLIYGIYHCFNVVTDVDGTPSAVLIRALQMEAFPAGQSDRSGSLHRLAAGPGKLCQIMQIDLSLTGLALEQGQPLWLEHRSPQFEMDLRQGMITFTQTSRIGITQGIELPWRWYVTGCKAVSKR